MKLSNYKKKDPVCGSRVWVDDDTHQSEFEGTVYHFCSRNCEERFRRTPERYLDHVYDRAETRLQ